MALVFAVMGGNFDIALYLIFIIKLSKERLDEGVNVGSNYVGPLPLTGKKKPQYL